MSAKGTPRASVIPAMETRVPSPNIRMYPTPTANDETLGSSRSMTAALPAKPWDDSYNEGLHPEEGPAELEKTVAYLYLGVRGRIVGAVDVEVRPIVVNVLVHVEATALQVPEYLRSKEDQHDADAEFKYRRDGVVPVENGFLESQDDKAEDEERGGMSQAP